jgi:uncharacterized protein with HEPN domain
MARLMLSTVTVSSLTFAPPPRPTPFMPSDAASAALRDIAHHIDLAAHFAAGFDHDTFRADLRTVYAVTQCLEIISEASHRLPDEMKARHPSIAWKDMAGDIYRHDYEDVAAQQVWDAVQIDLPPLRVVIEHELGIGEPPRGIWAVCLNGTVYCHKRPCGT